MQIQGITLTNLPNGAHFNLMDEVAQRLAALIADDAVARERVAQLTEAFNAALATEDEALKVSQKSLLTDAIADADAARDSLISLLKGLVDNWFRHPDPAMSTAAATLRQSLRDYGIDPSMQLDKETGLITNLVQDWQTTLAPQVATLFLTDTVGALKAKNDEVKELTARRADEYALRYSRNLRAARLATDDAYRAIIRRINAWLEIGADTVFDDFATYLNTRLTGYKQQVLRQSASYRGGGSGSATPEAPEQISI